MSEEKKQLTNEQLAIAGQLALKAAALGFPLKFLYLKEGPYVTEYIYSPQSHDNPLSKIVNRAPDFAFTIAYDSVLITPEMGKICIAVPNRERRVIKFDSCLNWLMTNAELDSIQLPVLMGQNTEGINQCLDLSTQPHMLIAGSTGSGKSIFLSQLIASLALRLPPSQLQFVLVDTKQLDLTLFQNLKHVTKLVDNIWDLYPELDILMSEVRRRTEIMKGLCRNIAEFNANFTRSEKQKLPYIVLVIDELADIIDQDKEIAKGEAKDEKRTRVRDSLRSLAQISRAAGIHIIAATQRPSIEIVSGALKANLPCRISFRLPSSIDSRVILGANGAEQLLGHGDYLFQSNGDSKLKRGHSAFITIADISKLIEQHDFIREMYSNMRIAD